MPFEICVQFVASFYLCTCCLFTDQSKPMSSHFCATKKQLCHCPFANVCRNVACPPCFANLQYCLKAAVSARRALKLIDSRYPTASAVEQHTDVSDAAIVLSIATDPLSSDSRAGLHSVDCNNLPTIPGQPDMVCPIHPSRSECQMCRGQCSTTPERNFRESALQTSVPTENPFFCQRHGRAIAVY